MAQGTFLTSKAFNVIFEVPTDKLSQNIVTDRWISGVSQRHYTADLVLHKHPECPAIAAAATYTLALTVNEENGAISATVAPTCTAEPTRPGLVLVDWQVRAIMKHLGPKAKLHKDKAPEKDWQMGSLGGAGDAVDGQPLEQLVCRNEVLDAYALQQRHDVYVSVCLTLIAVGSQPHCPCPCRALATLYETRLLADCTLLCGGREFPAHRALLAAQSPVFAAMFQQDMTEKATGTCTITDILPEVLEALLRFAYTGEINKAYGRLDLLWTAADKYDMVDLQGACSEHRMLESLSSENAAEYLWFAHQHGLTKLKVDAAKIISRQSV